MSISLQALSNGHKTNSWLVRRDFNGAVIIVNAQYIVGLESWGMTLKVNGILVDHRQADDPLETASQMIEIAIVNLAAMECDEVNERVSA